MIGANSIQADLHPEFSQRIHSALKAERVVTTVSFHPAEAEPEAILTVKVPKLQRDQLIVPGTLALVFDVDLLDTANTNYIVESFPRALVETMTTRFGTQTLETTTNYDIYKIFKDFFLSTEERNNSMLEGIGNADFRKVFSGTTGAATSGSDYAVAQVIGKKMRLKLDHDIVTKNGLFYPWGLAEHLEFEIRLAKANKVIFDGSSSGSKMAYKLKNIHLQYEVIKSKKIADEAMTVLQLGKEYYFDQVTWRQKVDIKRNADTLIQINLTPTKLSLKAVVLLFIEKYNTGKRDSTAYSFPDLTKVKVTVNGVPHSLYSNGIEAKYMWQEAFRFFVENKKEYNGHNMKSFYSGNRFGLVIDLRAMSDTALHGNGARLISNTNGVFLEIERTASSQSDTGTTVCHVFLVSDAQFNIMNGQFDSFFH